MKSYRVRLNKIISTHENLRTSEVEGESLALPTIGEGFILIGKSLTEGANARLVVTSEIKEVEQDGIDYVFKTLNSTYRLEILEVLENKDV